MELNHVLEPVPARDWLILAVVFLGVLALIGLSELIRRTLGWPTEFTRKLVHILVGVLMFFAPILLTTSLPMVVIGSFFTLSNWIALRQGWLKGMHGARVSYGTVFYPLSFTVLVLLCWPDHVAIIIAAMLVLALGDAAAAIVGETIAHPQEYVLIGERKSLEGSATMFVVTAAVVLAVLHFYPYNGTMTPLALGESALYAVLVAVLTTAAEALGRRGNDNLTVPLTTALVLFFLLTHDGDAIRQFTTGVGLAGMAAIVSWRVGFLAPSGAVALLLLASVIFGFGGWAWTVPILTFFILSSILSRVGRRVKARYDQVFEKGSRRDAYQVLANGGIPGALMILHMFTGAEMHYIYYLAALAAATADTWATEIGTMAGQRPRLITSMQPVEPGRSGGITPIGLLGAALGAIVLTASGMPFLPAGTQFLPVGAVIVAAGFAASLVDSAMGATVQVQYRCRSCAAITERAVHCDGTTEIASGFAWINNDAVNFISIIVAPLAAHAGALLLHPA